MALSEPVELVRRLGAASRVGAIVLAEQAVDAYGTGYGQPDERVIALDILLRAREPALDGFIGEVEIDLLHRDLARRAA